MLKRIQVDFKQQVERNKTKKKGRKARKKGKGAFIKRENYCFVLDFYLKEQKNNNKKYIKT